MEYRDIFEQDDNINHHEDTRAFQTVFCQHVKSLVATLKNKGPFSTTDLTTIGIERKVMDDTAIRNVTNASEFGTNVNCVYFT